MQPKTFSLSAPPMESIQKGDYVVLRLIPVDLALIRVVEIHPFYVVGAMVAMVHKEPFYRDFHFSTYPNTDWMEQQPPTLGSVAAWPIQGISSVEKIEISLVRDSETGNALEPLSP